MSSVTTYYGISSPVPFLDVDVLVDNRCFLDPHAIRLHVRGDALAAQAVECAESFIEEVLKCVLRGDSKRGLWLLQRFVEPWETRLGYANGGFRGHGGAEKVGTWIWRTLNNDLHDLTAIGLLRYLEDLPLFVEGVDRDITSDVATRIAFEALAKFTAHMVHLYPQFSAHGHRVETARCQAWDAATREWMVKPFLLPVAAGKPLLLVPRGWARPNLLMSAGRYHGTTVLDYIQQERAYTDASGKTIKTPKDRLVNEPGAGRGRRTNREVTHRAYEDNSADILALFRRYVDMKAPGLESGHPHAA